VIATTRDECENWKGFPGSVAFMIMIKHSQNMMMTAPELGHIIELIPEYGFNGRSMIALVPHLVIVYFTSKVNAVTDEPIKAQHPAES